jgi:hypothetical protein
MAFFTCHIDFSLEYLVVSGFISRHLGILWSLDLQTAILLVLWLKWQHLYIIDLV